MDEIIIFLATKLHLLVLLLAVVVFLVADKKKVQFAVKLALVTLPFSFLIGKLLSLVVISPRPFVVDNIVPLIKHEADNGFPSDHTLLAATVACIVFVYHKPMGVVLLFLSVLVGIARVLAGVHHYLDIAGSVLIAITTTYVAMIVIRRRRRF